MSHFDVFNGDADGICALIQLRLNNPIESTLITGVKRDNQLLERVHPMQGDNVNVLDISMKKNQPDLRRILDCGAIVFYVDHHQPGDIPVSKNLTAIINQAVNVCTSSLIHQYLNNKYCHNKYITWAITGAFGDNLSELAQSLCADLSSSQVMQLKQLGIYINYNSYGTGIDELHFHPIKLYSLLVNYTNALDFSSDCVEQYQQLESGYQQDLTHAQSLPIISNSQHTALVILPNTAWSRRVNGVYANLLANQYPNRAHALLTENDTGGFVVSVRAPLNNKHGAAELCQQFNSGGGREAAAGINHLPQSLQHEFSKAFAEQYN